MFNLQQCGREGGDCTAPYKVILDRSYTVRTFIDAVLNGRSTEWGYIGINDGHTIFGNPSCEYRYGKLQNAMNECVLDKAVISVKASGGWTRMDYLIKV